ncbi:MAG TPA: serine hydrolase [Streptosporangiaceae bacterium]|nr:serine hydrolase [Streptosporangiaceae bacterium]
MATCAVLAAVPARAAGSGYPAVAGAAVCRAWPHGGKTRTGLAARLSRDIRGVLRHRGDRYAVRMLDPFLGVSCGINARQHFGAASVVKAAILAALLRTAQARHRALTRREKSLAWLMITHSDNNAASALWNDVGRYRMQRFLDLAGMKDTVLGPAGFWGLTLLTAHDETLLLWLLLDPSPVLTKASRRYELRLTARVIPAQRWGVPAGSPAGFTVHVKNGWAPLNAPDWNINSIGCFTRGDGTQDYSIVVLTAGNPDMAYGVATIEDVAAKIHHDLSPRLRAAVPRSTPNRSWNTPDEPLP